MNKSLKSLIILASILASAQAFAIGATGGGSAGGMGGSTAAVGTGGTDATAGGSATNSAVSGGSNAVQPNGASNASIGAGTGTNANVPGAMSTGHAPEGNAGNSTIKNSPVVSGSMAPSGSPTTTGGTAGTDPNAE